MTNAQNHPLLAYRKSFEPAKGRAELARELGVDRSTIARWETRRRRPEDKYLPILATLTGASIPELMGLPDPEAKQ